MTKDSTGPKVWTKPRIKPLGEIKDVAGAQTPIAQASNAKS
jgi:hypothetical protein